MRVIFRLAMSGVIASGGLGSEVLVDAMPQRGGFVPVPIAPVKNTTASSPAATESASASASAPASTWTSAFASASTCNNSCVVEYPALTAIHWIPEVQVVYTTEVTVATVSVVYTTSGNLTSPPRTDTVWNQAPESSLYHIGTDERGTAIVTFATINHENGFWTFSTLTYPTPFIDYGSSYAWRGVLQTPNKGADPACATALPKPERNLLAQHPEYPPPKDISPGNGDEFGAGYIPLWLPPTDDPDPVFFSAAFPNIFAFQSCSPLPHKKPSDTEPTHYAAEKLVTATTTTYISAKSTDHIVIIQPTATGWDDNGSLIPKPPTSSPKPSPPDTKTDGWGIGAPTIPVLPPGVNPNVSPGGNLDPTLAAPNPPQTPQPQNQNPPSTPAPAPTVPVPTPIFTLLPTTIFGTPTLSPAFLLPLTSAHSPRTLPPGATVTLSNDLTTITTVLTAPSAFFTYLPTTLNGVFTSIPVYVVSGTSVASVGQTVTLEGGRTTVLEAPTGEGGSWVAVSTTVGGSAAVVGVYVVSGVTTVFEGVSETGAGEAIETGLEQEQGGEGFARPEETAGVRSGANGILHRRSGYSGVLWMIVGWGVIWCAY